MFFATYILKYKFIAPPINPAHKVFKEKSRVLILVPHYDDEILGCYNLMANCLNISFDLMYVTDSGGNDKIKYDSKARRKESEAALCNISNIVEKFYLDIPDQQVYLNQDILTKNLVKIEKEYEYILSPAFWDSTSDHSVIAKVLLTIVNIEKIVYYRSTDYTFMASDSSFCASGAIFEKLRALNFFRSQRHLALFNPLIFSFVYQGESRMLETRECFLFAREAADGLRINNNTLRNKNPLKFENFTDK